MSIEIRELVIRAQVDEPARQQTDAASSRPAPGGTSEEREALLRECVARVMQTLREQQER